MTKTTIVEVFAWEAFDSRGKPTVGCRVRLAAGAAGRAIVPSGASIGSHEARELRDGGPRYGGQGVSRAVAAVNEILSPAIQGLDAADQAAVDNALEAADGTPALERLGANAVLAVSLAAALASANDTALPLYQVIGGDAEPWLPLPMVNIISGGAHAGGAIDIQDVLVVPVGAGSFAEAMEWAWRVRAAAAELLGGHTRSSALVADEGGLAAEFDSNESALALVCAAIRRAGLQPGAQVALAVDCAANQLLHRDGRYSLRREQRELDRAAWLDELTQWCHRYPIVSLEDGLAEDDWEGWRDATARLAHGMQLLGDDLFATNSVRLQRGIDEGIANAILVKPNQAGTLTRTERVFQQARAAGYATVLSARSGDTEDSWLSDLAVGWSAGQIKVGSITRAERTAKWNRLLEIEADLSRDKQCFAGAAALAGRLHVNSVIKDGNPRTGTHQPPQAE